MSTRGCIARLTGSQPWQFRGVYHHWDSYPSGLGRALFRARNWEFVRDTEAMLKALIDNHPAGWSTVVNGNLVRLKGVKGKNHSDEAPQCYCHGNRQEKSWPVTESNVAGSGVEYVYAFSGSKMLILESFCGDGNKMIGMFGSGDENASWEVIAEVDLNGAEPDWDELDERGPRET